MPLVAETRIRPSDANRRAIPAGIQVLSILAFAGFAISTSIVAMDESLIAGVGLAALHAYFWSRIPTLSGGLATQDTVQAVRPDLPADAPRRSGNASFDAYRQNMLDRLEQEQDKFEDFLSRLREARDQTEFDRFMDDRAARLDRTPDSTRDTARDTPELA